MYTQILKEILLSIDLEQVHFDAVYYITVANNSLVILLELIKVEKLRNEYRDPSTHLVVHLPVFPLFDAQ